MNPAAPAVAPDHAGAAVEPPAPLVPRRERLTGTPSAAVPNRAVGAVLHSLDEGRPLPDDVRRGLEGYVRQDLGSVRIHDGQVAVGLAKRLDAHAFTVADHLVMGQGEFAPDTAEGSKLLAHEVAHSLQQRVGGMAIDRAAIGAPDAGPKERQARQAGKQRVKAYQFTVDGKTVTLDEASYKREVARATKNLTSAFYRVEQTAQGFKETEQDFLKNTHNWAGTISDWIGDTTPPDLGIWSWPHAAIKNGRQALADGRLESAAKQLQLAQNSFRDAQHEWNVYMEKTIGGAGTAITALEYTRDISFSIAIATAAVVAAPVVAGAAAAAGLGTVATAAVTGLTVTAGGAVVGGTLRGGSNVAGQALTGDPINWQQAGAETIEGAKKGAVDAGSAVVGFGAGKALRVGAAGGGIVKNVVRAGVAGSASGSFGSGLDAALHGKSGTEIVKEIGKGGVSGFVGGSVGGAGTRLLGETSTAARTLVGGVSGGVGSATGAVLSGASGDDLKKAIATGVLAGGATSAAATHGPTPVEGAPPPVGGTGTEPVIKTPTARAGAEPVIATPTGGAGVEPVVTPPTATPAAEPPISAPSPASQSEGTVSAPGKAAATPEPANATVPTTDQPITPMPADIAPPEPAAVPPPATAKVPSAEVSPTAKTPSTEAPAALPPSSPQPATEAPGPATAAPAPVGAAATPKETFYSPEEIDQFMSEWGKAQPEAGLPSAPADTGVTWGGAAKKPPATTPAAEPTVSEPASLKSGVGTGATEAPSPAPPPKMGHVLEGYPPEHIEMPWEPGMGETSELGYRRDKEQFWDEYKSKWGDQLSGPENIKLRADGKSPIVDDVWIKSHPEHAPYKGQKLIHHHVGEGGTAVALPESLHHAHSVVHPTSQVVGAAGKVNPPVTRARAQQDIERFGKVGSAKGGRVGKIFGVSKGNLPAISPVGLKSPLAARPAS